jgi:hypothetical protein
MISPLPPHAFAAPIASATKEAAPRAEPALPARKHDRRGPRRLFPGRVPGQPIANHALTNRLNRHGISARPARNGALAALAADLPAAILADLLGMHVTTAVRWVTYARRDWADYLAARTSDQRENER